MEYIPVVFSVAAACHCVFLPDVPFGTQPAVRKRTSNPKMDIKTQKASQNACVTSPKARSIYPEPLRTIIISGIHNNGK